MGENAIIVSLILFNIFFLAFIGGIIIFVRQYRIKKKAHIKQLEAIDFLHKKELLETQMEIQSQTMKYIGREIHDNIGQKLTLSSLYLQQLVFENKTLKITENVNNVNDIINESLTELRHLSKSLTDDTVKHHSIAELIKTECEKIEVLKIYNISYNCSLDLELSSYQAKSILLRVTQEFLQNSIKHSMCENIEVSIFNTKNNLILILKDDGKGFNIKNTKNKGIGLKNMQKRVEMIQGEFRLKSGKRKGTKLTVKIPI